MMFSCIVSSRVVDSRRADLCNVISALRPARTTLPALSASPATSAIESELHTLFRRGLGTPPEFHRIAHSVVTKSVAPFAGDRPLCRRGEGPASYRTTTYCLSESSEMKEKMLVCVSPSDRLPGVVSALAVPAGAIITGLTTSTCVAAEGERTPGVERSMAQPGSPPEMPLQWYYSNRGDVQTWVD